jgi:small-conductance mechanosensitive channel
LLIGLLPLWLASAAGAAESGWSGAWETRWRDGQARLELQQQDERVTGRLDLQGVAVEGRARGRVFEGHWRDGHLQAALRLILAPDGQSFVGQWDAGAWVTGSRLRDLPAGEQADFASPRAALRSFIRSFGPAGGGAAEVPASALQALDFGADHQALTLDERARRARLLYQLIDQTTFRLAALPAEAAGTERVVRLPQAASEAVLQLTFTRDAAGVWRIRVPEPTELAAARRSLLLRSGGEVRAADGYLRLASPRDALRSFLVGVAAWDSDGKATALAALDLAEFHEALRETNGALAALQIHRLLQLVGPEVLQEVPDHGADRTPNVVFAHPAGTLTIAPVGEGSASRWMFAAASVASAGQLLSIAEELAVPVAPAASPPHRYFVLRAFVRDHVPVLLGRVGRVEYWQPLAALLLISCTALLGYLAAIMVRGVLRRRGFDTGSRSDRLLPWSLGLAVTVLLAFPAADALGLPPHIRQRSFPVAGSLFTLAIGHVAWYVSSIVGQALMRRGELTETTADDILAMLMLGVARLCIAIGIVLGIAHALSLSPTGVWAGLGISGIALALASKETVSNIFGAAILASDRPFRRGDWIVATEVEGPVVEGAVEEVGIRSTRVRTAEDSLTVVPNGKLADSTITNLGRRHAAALRLSLPVTAGATPQRLEALADWLRARVDADAAFLPGRTKVLVSGISDYSIAVELSAQLSVATTAAAQKARHVLLLDVLSMAPQLGLMLGSGMNTGADDSATAPA